MSQDEFDEFRPRTLATLAAELVRAHGSAPDAARRSAERSLESLIPGGRLPAPDQHLYSIRREREPVGGVWFGIRRDHSVTEAYIWDLWIEPEWRKHGIATAAMDQLEIIVKGLGIRRVALNVFAHNTDAARLYERLGYVPVSAQMTKRL